MLDSCSERLEDDFDILMLDAIAHGLSSRIDLSTRDDHGSNVAAVIQALNLNRF